MEYNDGLHQSLELDFSLTQQVPKASQAGLLGDQERLNDSKGNVSTSSNSLGNWPPILWSLIYEILSLVLAAGAFIFLIAIFHKYNTKQTPEWSLGPWGVTLNAIVSILSTVFRASLLTPVASSISQLCWTWYTRPRPLEDICLYDSASRGPLGSIRLLVRLRFMHFASIGAFITIAALALDPLIQQSVRYYPQSVISSNSHAQAVAAYDYNTGLNSGEYFTNAFIWLPNNMKSAIYSGLLSSDYGSIPNPLYSCPTGNCTWDPYGTLAVNAQCENITSHVQLNCTSHSTTSSSSCNFVAAEDQVLKKMLNGSTIYDFFVMQSNIAEDVLPILQPYANTTGYLATVQWVKVTSPNSQSLPWIAPNNTFEASRCTFYLSVIELLSKVSEGVYSEEVQQEYTRAENAPTNATYEWNGTNYYFSFPQNLSAPFTSDAKPLIYKPQFAKTGANKNDTFVVSYSSWAMLSSQISDPNYLTGKITQHGVWGFSGPDIPYMLYQASNVTRAMYNMAQSMTNTLRANDSLILQQEQQNASLIAPEQAILGNVWVQEQFVNVRWVLLTLPFILLLLAILLLAATFLETRHNGVGLWQSSPLTLFFHGQFNDKIQSSNWEAHVSSMNTAKAMQDAVAGLNARITKSDRRTIEMYERT